jgi:hypothetical protein
MARDCRDGHIFCMPETDVGLDAVVEAYKRDIDRTLLRENLKKSPEDRLRSLMALQRFALAARAAGRAARAAS